MASKHVTLTIDGTEVSVLAGTTILEAAKQAGVLVPHYCYHPGLPIAGVCRMCLVTVENAPKLQIACATPVAEGMVVDTQADEAKNARTGVLELLLINHPLDCPICDQAGECELQDYTFQEGRPNTRYQEHAKRFAPVEDFGPDILYVPNRCILCTRCVRFMEDVAQDPVLNVSERGDRAYIGIHPDVKLEHPWSGNVVDLCPVGSLLSKDFLHKARAWELDKTPSICTGCSQGCNVMIDIMENAVVRLRPRPNDDVNQYWMCDHGRLHYKWMNRGDRIEAPLVRDGTDLQATDWNHALQRGAEVIKGGGPKAVILASANASLEAMALAREVVEGLEWIGAVHVPIGKEHPLTGVPDLALRSERAANAQGATLLGYSAAYRDAVQAARDAAVVLVLADPLEATAQFETAGSLLYLGTALPDRARGAALVFPTTNVAEEDGTYVNRDGRVQRYFQGKAAPGMARPAWWILSEMLVELGKGEHLTSAAEAFERIPELGGLTYSQLGLRGTLLSTEVSV